MNTKQDAMSTTDMIAIRKKYQEERDKRIRNDGIEQFHYGVGEFSHFVDDPYSDPTFNRPALNDEVDVIIIGGGFGGLLTAARLYQHDIRDVRIIEQGSDVGGTWYWNRFPGARCDTESYIYMPLLEELGYLPTEKYASGSEIREHCQRIAKAHGVYDKACFQTQATEIRWDEKRQRWQVSTDRGDSMWCQFVCTSSGILNRAKLPGIEGIRDFQGRVFHTSRWDYDYTGGSPTERMTKLKDKHVGVVGTGATAIQCIPELALDAGHLTVFQRTPSSIDVRANRPTDADWQQQLAAGWQRQRIDNFNHLLSGVPVDEDLVNDGWTAVTNMLTTHIKTHGMPESSEALAALSENIDCQKMSQIRTRVEHTVNDAVTAEALKPWYRQWCKRPCFHDEYLETYNRSNVSLVDTKGKGVEKILSNAVIANGETYPIDCLVFATGFDFFAPMSRRLQCTIVGKHNTVLANKWADGVSSLFGMHTRDFPNLFIMANDQSANTVNFTHTLDEQAKHIAYVIEESKKSGYQTVDVEQQAEAQWVEKILEQQSPMKAIISECTPSFYNNEGSADIRPVKNSFITSTTEYFQILTDWRNAGELKGLKLS